MSTENNSQTPSPFNRWWVISGVGLALIAVALVVVLVALFMRDNSTPAVTQPSPSGSASADPTAEPSPPESASPGESACGLPGGTDIPVAAPEADWDNSNLLLVPRSEEFGPEPLPGSEWSCFAHSPTGALFAASHYIAGVGDENYESFMKAASVDNASLDTYLETTSPGSHKQEPGRVAQIVGYQFESVEDDVVIVSLAFQLGDIVASFRLGMVWDEAAGTWKGDVSRSDLTLAEANLNTYTPWSASGA